MQKLNNSTGMANKTNNNMMLRGPSWANSDGGSNKNIITTCEDDDELLDLLVGVKDICKTSDNSSLNGASTATAGNSTMSMFQDSFSSFGSAFRGAVDNAIGSLKENVESEIVIGQTEEETRRDYAVKKEKDASIAQIMGDDQFRRFKKEMKDSGAVTSGAINQAMSRNIGKRASLDMQPRYKSTSNMDTKSQNRATSLDLRKHQPHC
jgi:hypothetical protein